MSFELEAARQKLAERVQFWQRQLDEVIGKGVLLEVDPRGLPSNIAKLADFANTGLGELRNALADATRDGHFAAYFRSRVSKVLVRNDDDAPTSRFDFDVNRQLLVVITTSQLKQWLDFLGFQEFLRHEL